MPLFTRESLKNFFKKGKFPTEIHFAHLIDSTVNKIDDGFSKSEQSGLELAPQGHSERLISFYRNINEASPEWQIDLAEVDNKNGLSIESVSISREGAPVAHPRLFLAKNGRVGLNTQKPEHLLDVRGTASTINRVGALAYGQVPGDGKWHDMLSGLTGLQSFEVVARIEGPKKRGRYAITHAIALSTFGRSNSKIKQVRAHYGWFWNRISLRWKSEWIKTEGADGQWVHRLQIKTQSHYGYLPQSSEVVPIRYHVTGLWDEHMLFPKREEAPRQEEA